MILMKLGADGLLIHAPEFVSEGWLTDRVESLIQNPKDVSGAGDSMLVLAALTLAAGGNIRESACLGSISAATHVSRVGNTSIRSRSCNRLGRVDRALGRFLWAS